MVLPPMCNRKPGNGSEPGLSQSSNWGVFHSWKELQTHDNYLDLDPRLRCGFGVVREAAEKVNYKLCFSSANGQIWIHWLQNLLKKDSFWVSLLCPSNFIIIIIPCLSSSADDHTFSWIKSGFSQVVLITPAQSSALFMIRLPDASSTAFIPYKTDKKSAC